MSQRKTTIRRTKQSGFLTVGVGLALLAIYGAVGTGILATHEPASIDDEVVASQDQVALSLNAGGDLDGQRGESSRPTLYR